jgi:hypothetical protein
MHAPAVLSVTWEFENTEREVLLAVASVQWLVA